MTYAFDEATIFDHVKDAVIVTDHNFHIARWNNGAAALYGWTAAEVLRRSMQDVVPVLRYLDGGNDGQAAIKLRTNGAWNGLVVQQHRDGRELSIDASIRVLYDDNHTPFGIIAINRDIGERLTLIEQERTARISAQAAQQRLEVLARASHAFAEAELELPAILNTIVEQVSASIGDACSLRLLDEDRRMLLPGSIAHTDREIRAFLQRVFGDNPVPVGDGILGQVAATRAPFFAPHISVGHPDRTMHAFSEFPSVIRAGAHSRIIVPLLVQDRLLGVLALARDITPTPYTEDDLQLAQELADRAALAIDRGRLFQAMQEAVRAREVFLSVAAHELRTPLTSILGHVFRLTRQAERATALSEQMRRSLVAIDAQGQRLNMLIEELLDVSRLQLGTFTIARKPLDIGALVRRVTDEIGATVERHQFFVQAPLLSVQIMGDQARLEQVFYNILHNAIKYSPQGGAITISIMRRAETVSIAVSDRGMGIPAADILRLFQQFYRASNIDATRISGLGIGLYLVEAIVTLHEGSVAVESEEGVGSTFTVTLPALPDAPHAAER